VALYTLFDIGVGCWSSSRCANYSTCAVCDCEQCTYGTKASSVESR